MVNVANIVCKTAGLAGLTAVTYDAYEIGKHHASAGTAEMSADIFEKTIAAERSNSNASHVSNVVQKKIADIRMKNPIIPLFGKIKGFVKGFIETLGDNFIPIALSSIALTAKGRLQKAGAWALGIYGAYILAKEGFGLGKTSPVDE